mgnify:FL=1
MERDEPTVKIVVDAMGGDNAPQVPVEASVKAVNSKDINIILTGKKELLEAELAKYDYEKGRIEIVDCREVITNHDEPVKAVRTKRDSSMVAAAKLLSEGKADAMLSQGNTGALLSAGLLIVGRIKGILRPAIGTLIPTDKGPKLLIDAGANTNCRGVNLLQFAMMGSIYMNKAEGIDNPKVGLVNNGEEEEKGTELTKEAYGLLEENKYGLNFIGNLEGREMMEGAADVIVCDGFSGNIILKTLEGMGKVVSRNLKNIFSGGVLKTLGGLFVYGGLKDFKKKMDYREYGGAPLIGLKKPIVKGHGASDVKAAYAAIVQIEKFVRNDINKEIEKMADMSKTQGKDGNVI